jgi:hypothetical protein
MLGGVALILCAAPWASAQPVDHGPPEVVVTKPTGPAGPPAARPLRPVGPYDALQTGAYNFEVTSSGEAAWSMPIWAPVGRNGIAPSLSFSYRSRRSPGLMGQGFDVSGLSSVARCWRTVAQDGHFAAGPTAGVPDVFCLDGQRLVPHGTSTNELQPEFDPSVLVRVNGPADAPTSFDVYRRNGQIWRYGSREACPSSSQSQVKGSPLVVSAPRDANGRFTSDDFTEAASPTQLVVAWNVDRVEDRWGNSFDVDYIRGSTDPWSPEVLPGAVTWTRFKATACSDQAQLEPSRRILFVYVPNRDGSFMARRNPRSVWRGGVEIRQSGLLWKVVVEGPDALVSTPAASRHVRAFREYRMDYRPTRDGVRVLDQLESITECVYNTPQAIQCREPVSFSWTADNPAVPEFLPAKDPVQAYKDDPSLDQDMRFDTTTGVDDVVASELDSVVADFDGDGRDDFLYRTLWFVRPSNIGGVPNLIMGQWFLRLGTPTGLGPRHTVRGLPATGGGDPRFSPRAIDIDQDGQAEVLLYSEDALVQQTLRGDPSLNSYNVTDTYGYEVYKLAPHGCLTSPFHECNFTPLNMGESRIYHPLELVPRNSIAVQVGDLDGDGQLDLTRDDTDCPFSFACATAPAGASQDVSAGFRRGSRPAGLFGAQPSFGSPQTIRRDFPAVGPFTNIDFHQFEGRYLVDLNGNGQHELLTTVYNGVPIETPPIGPAGQYPFSLAALSFNASGDGQVGISQVTLSARPLSMSPMMARLRGGPCAAKPDEYFYNVSTPT